MDEKNNSEPGPEDQSAEALAKDKAVPTAAGTVREPVIAARQPCVLEMKPGEYYWCSCGRSQSQPFCDGSHAGTGFEPVQFTVVEERRMALCACKHSKNSYMCDGTHSKL